MDKSKARNVDYKAPASANKESFLGTDMKDSQYY